MTIAELKKQGYQLLNVKPYKAQKTTLKQYIIVLNAATMPEGERYYEAVDKAGNILLVRTQNLTLD